MNGSRRLLCLPFLEQYANAVASGSTLYDLPSDALYQTVALTIAPLVNPDGVDLVTGYLDEANPAFASASAIANTYRNIPFRKDGKPTFEA